MSLTRREAFKAAAAGVALAAAADGAAQEPAVPETPPAPLTAQDELAKIAALLEGDNRVMWVFAGDSITHGARHLHGERDYPQLFEERLRYELRKFHHLVVKTATSGWTIRQNAEDLDWRVLQFRPHVASFHLGMNDCKGGTDGLQAFRDTYRGVIDRVRGECGSAIILHTPNPILPTASAERIEFLPSYVAAVRELAAEKGAILVDNYAAMEEYAGAADLHYIMNDAIHPNAHGHIFTAHLMFRTLNMWDDTSEMCRLFVPR